MIHWENSRSTEQRHQHTLVPNSRGQNICSSCQEIIFKPIISSDDPRLENAGLHRSGQQEMPFNNSPFPAPLPIQLISMYKEDYDFPVAPYLMSVVEEFERRRQAPPWATAIS